MPLWKVDAGASAAGSSATDANGDAVMAPSGSTPPRSSSEAAPPAAEAAIAAPSDPEELKRAAYQSASTYLLPPSSDGSGSSAEPVLPPDELPAPLEAAVRARAVSLLDLIRHLRESLTSEEVEVRSLAVQLLGLVVTTFAPAPAPGAAADAASSAAGDDEALRKKLFDKQAVLTLVAFFSSKLEDGEAVAAEIARRLNASTAPAPASAGWTRQAGEGGARIGDQRWPGATVPRGSEMLAAAVVALQRLLALETCGVEAAKACAQALIEHVKPTNHPQALRFLIFRLLDTLIARHRSHALRSMGASFLRGYISLAKGEKDPRNLMLLFATDRVLLIDFADVLEQDEHADLVEAFFDITFCYFPITFRPPPDDPYGITAADLKAALRGCLTANARLAPHAMPLLLEKLSATGGAAKLDTLDTLREALPVYGRAAVQAHEKSLWENLKIEILHATDKETGLAAQETLVSMLACLYTIPTPVDPPAGLAPRIMAEMLAELDSPDKVLAAPAASVVACLVRAGASTAYFAIFGALERLLALFEDPEEVALRAPILGHIATLLRALRASYAGPAAADDKGKPKLKAGEADGSSAPKLGFAISSTASSSSSSLSSSAWTALTHLPARSYDGDRRPLDSVRDALLAALHNGIRSASYRASALAAFVQACHIDGFLEPQEVGYLAEATNELLVRPDPPPAQQLGAAPDADDAQEKAALVGAGSDEVRKLAMDALIEVAKINSRAIETTTLPLLLEKLPDSLSAGGEAGDADSDVQMTDSGASDGARALTPAEIRQRAAIRHSLGALARLGTQSSLFDILIVKLLTKFDLALTRPCAGALQRAANVGYARGLLSTLYTISREKRKRGDRDLGKYAASSIPRLLLPMVAHLLEPPQGASASTIAPPAADPALLRDVAALLTLFVASMTLEKQQELARRVYRAIEDGAIDQLLEQPRFRRSKDAADKTHAFEPLDNPAHRDAWSLLAAMIVPLQQAVPLPFGGDVTAWVQRQLQWLQGVRSLLQLDACALTLASAVNKHTTDPLPEALSQLLHSFFENEIKSASAPRRAQSLRAWLCILKGLAIRNSKVLDGYLAELMALCEDDSIGPLVAKSLDVLAKEDTEVLTKANGHVVRLLYRQRLFSNLLPKVIAGYRQHASSDASAKQSTYLIALTALLPHMPRSTTQDRLPELFPLLIRALDLPDAQTRGSAANTIAAAVISAHIQKRRAEEEEVQSKTRRVAAGASMNDSTKSGDTYVALTLAEDHIGSLITRLLAIIDPQQTALETSRIAAVRCLAALARSLPYLILHPHRVTVQRALAREGMGVDDPRRSVRLEAVEARDVWFSLRE